MCENEGAGLRDAAMAGGDTAKTAFQSLWQAYYRRLSVFAALYRGLPSAERDDAVSDALIAAFSALASYDPRRPLSAWVYRIAANRFSDAARRAARMSTISVGPDVSADNAGEGFASRAFIDPPAQGDHAEALVYRDLAERCRNAIAALPESDRRIAMLRFYEDLSAVDIGRTLGMPAGTVRWRIHRIRATLAATVGEDTP
ncbi:MAG: hypothetical protein A2Y38_08605 [Spirochaetes bacterium GWB1_59_5]|nr:MAG: hypothetical protein A2Y38_08605 [Spirochaetes bacterium GWB1_59_5]